MVSEESVPSCHEAVTKSLVGNEVMEWKRSRRRSVAKNPRAGPYVVVWRQYSRTASRHELIVPQPYSTPRLLSRSIHERREYKKERLVPCERRLFVRLSVRL